jgi:hypothetical protein
MKIVVYDAIISNNVVNLCNNIYNKDLELNTLFIKTFDFLYKNLNKIIYIRSIIVMSLP